MEQLESRKQKWPCEDNDTGSLQGVFKGVVTEAKRWLALAPPTLLGPGSRHCHGINSTHWPGLPRRVKLAFQWLFIASYE